MSFKNQVIEIIQKIPTGKITTYGTVATLAGLPRGGRLVGGILHFNTEKLNLPWYRVIGKHGFTLRASANKGRHKEQVLWGFISTKCFEHPKLLQKKLLEEEGVEVSADFMVDLDKYGWFG